NPFLALANAARLTRETVVVVNPLPEAAWESNVMGGYTCEWANSGGHGGKSFDHLREPHRWVPTKVPPTPGIAVQVKQALKRLVKPAVKRLLKRPALPPPPAPLLTQVPCMVFVPQYDAVERPCTWWYVSPVCVQQMLAVLGFEDSSVTYHSQRIHGRAV